VKKRRAISTATSRGFRLRTDLRGHLARARNNGVSDAELIEVVTHFAFYAGSPSAVTAVGVAREVYREQK